MPGTAGRGAPPVAADEPLPDTAPVEAPELLETVVVGEPERGLPALLGAAAVVEVVVEPDRPALAPPAVPGVPAATRL